MPIALSWSTQITITCSAFHGMGLFTSLDHYHSACSQHWSFSQQSLTPWPELFAFYSALPGQFLVSRTQAQASSETSQAKDIATSVFQNLWVANASHKTEGLASQVVFLGFWVDMVSFQLWLPKEKLACMKELWWNRHSRDLESLLGYLSNAATAIRPRRRFLRHLLALLSSTPESYNFIHFNCSVRVELHGGPSSFRNGTYFLISSRINWLHQSCLMGPGSTFPAPPPVVMNWHYSQRASYLRSLHHQYGAFLVWASCALSHEQQGSGHCRTQSNLFCVSSCSASILRSSLPFYFFLHTHCRHPQHSCRCIITW